MTAMRGHCIVYLLRNCMYCVLCVCSACVWRARCPCRSLDIYSFCTAAEGFERNVSARDMGRTDSVHVESAERTASDSTWGGAPFTLVANRRRELTKNIANPHPPLSLGTADHTPSRKRVLRSFFLLVPPTLAPLQQPCKWVSQQLTQSRASSRICLFYFDYDRRTTCSFARNAAPSCR